MEEEEGGAREVGSDPKADTEADAKGKNVGGAAPKATPKSRVRRGTTVRGTAPGEYHDFDTTAAEGRLSKVLQGADRGWLVLRAQYPLEEEPLGEPEDEEEQQRAVLMRKMDAEDRFQAYADWLP